MALILGMASVSFMTSSCSSEEETVYYSYQVNPEGEFDVAVLDVCEQMRDGLEAAFGELMVVSNPDDARAIAICDEVYEQTRDQQYSGNVVLTRSETVSDPDQEGETVVLKIYEY